MSERSEMKARLIERANDIVSLEGIALPSMPRTVAVLREAAARIGELEVALGGAVKAARDAHEHWDADRDSKVGKILAAMSGYLEGYRPDCTAIHEALAGLAPTKPEGATEP
jgi:hypothetical protein